MESNQEPEFDFSETSSSTIKSTQLTTPSINVFLMSRFRKF